jgi:FkbM family methyltransferase
MPAIRKRLVQNLVYNGVRDKVSVVFAAASNQDGVGDLTYTPAMEFTAGASLSRALSAHPLHRRVDLIKIDSLVPYDVTAMKIDVERHEIEVLEGAKDTIERCRPRLIIECFETDRREQISEMLPNYAPPIEMDGRNVLYEPQ